MSKPPKQRGRLVISGALVIGALGAAGYWFKYKRVQPEVNPYETVLVERGDITARVTATGTVSALVTVQVGSQVSGRIQKLAVDFNSPVTKGQMVAKLDPELFKAAVEQARANFAAAKGNLARVRAQAADAKRQAERQEELAKRNLIALADRDTALANATAAAAQVEANEGTLAQTKAALHQAEVNLTYATVVSPIDGVVISRNVDVGQTVAASLQAPVLFTIAEDLKKMQVDTNVAEADVGKLQPGMKATFIVDAYPGQRFEGQVRQIRNAPQTIQNVVTYDAVIDVANPELKLKPGMTANVTFVYADRHDVLRVANPALRYRPPAEALTKAVGSEKLPSGSAATGSGTSGRDVSAARAGFGQAGGGRPVAAGERGSDQRSVWVLSQGVPERRQVKTGVTDGGFTEVVSGNLNPGETVIVGSSAEAAVSKSNGLPGASPMQRRLF